MADNSNPTTGAGATTGSATAEHTSTTGGSTQSPPTTRTTHSSGSMGASANNDYNATRGSHQTNSQGTQRQSQGREVVLVERQRSKPSTTAVVSAALAGAIAGGAIPFMLSGRKGTSTRSYRNEGTAHSNDYDRIDVDARSRNKDLGGRR